MQKLVAVVFNNEQEAREGVRVLSEMDSAGTLDVPVMYMIKKESEHGVSTEEVTDDYKPVRTVAGTAVGALVGALGGLPGAAAGAGVGALAGFLWDLYTIGVDQDFFADVATALTPGRCAVVAEVDEEWVTPLDTQMEALGGVVYRTPKPTAQEDRWRREAANAATQLAQLRIEWAQARADRKAKLQAHIENLSKHLDAKLASAQEQSRQVAHEYEARLEALQRKAEKHQGEARAAVEARIARLRKDYQSRVHA